MKLYVLNCSKDGRRVREDFDRRRVRGWRKGNPDYKMMAKMGAATKRCSIAGFIW
jgi:hypothetical protein